MNNMTKMKNKIAVGSATVWAILLVSLAATLAYWYVLSGIESASQLSQFWQVIIWLVVAVGAVAEIIKKVTLSTFRNRNIWLIATFVSVVTVMGTYSILDQTRQNDLTKQSDSYKDSRANKQGADAMASRYAYASSYHLADLEKQYDQVATDRANRKIKYLTYKKRRASLEQKIQAKRAYESAIATSSTASSNMTNGNATGSSANSLLSNIAGVFNGSEALIKMLFYLLVTILLEVAAFWIGGQVETMKHQLHLTEAELLDMKNLAVFGFSMKDMQRGLFDRVNRAEQDSIEAEKEVQKIRKTRKNEDGQPLSSGAVAEQVNVTRLSADDNRHSVKAETAYYDLPDQYQPKQKVGFVDTDNRPTPIESRAKASTMERQKSLPMETISNPSEKLVSDPARRVKNGLEKGSKNGLKRSTDLLFPDWKRAVLNGNCKPSVTGSRRWVQQRIASTQDKKTYTPKEIGFITDGFFTRAISEGFIHENPDYRNGRAKYLLTRL